MFFVGKPGKKGKKKGSDSDSDEDWGKNKKAPGSTAKKGGGGGKGKGGGYTRAITLSPELAAVVGAEQMARHEVVKKVWSIIKERNLYVSIICNYLCNIFHTLTFSTLLLSYFRNHIYVLLYITCIYLLDKDYVSKKMIVFTGP